MTFRVAAVLWCAAAMVICDAQPVHAQRQSKESLAAIDSWVRTVNEHVPGRPDPAAARIAAMTYTSRRELNTAYSLFVRVLTERDVVVTHTEMDRAVTRLARAMRADPGTAAFLKRAAVLHSDALVFGSRFPAPPDDAPARVPPQRGTSAGLRSIPVPAPPPLLTNERVTLTRDGEMVGDGPVSWQLPFARSLLNELLPRRGDANVAPQPCAGESADAVRRSGRSVATCTSVFAGTFAVSAADLDFVGAWYHAIAAFLFATGRNGDATSHLHEAARVLPDDPRLLFDRASYAETFGLPLYQAVHETAARGVINSGIPAEAKTNAEAERLYRGALQIAPDYLEARVRLSRLLDHRGQRDEAATHIGQVLERRPDGVVGYYARMVAGRVAAGRGRHEDALAHYREAAAMYPGAQSALLGASHAALMAADVPHTLEPLAGLGNNAETTESDPWLDYHLGAGRDVRDLITALWETLSK